MPCSPTRLGAVLGVLVLLAAALCLTGAPGGASPPPPNFWDFTVVNSTGMDVTNVNVEFTHGAGPDYKTQPAQPTLTTTLSAVPSGRTVGIGTPGWHGVSRIRVTASCNGATVTCTIQAQQADFTGDGQAEFAGFCPRDASEAPVFLGVRFLPPSGGQPLRAELKGLSRWETQVAWQTDVKPFQ